MAERLVAGDGDRLAVSGDTEADGTFPVLNGGRVTMPSSRLTLMPQLEH